MSKERVFDDRFTRSHRLEEVPQMRLNVVVVGHFEGDGFGRWLLAEPRLVLRFPLLFVGVAHSVWEAAVVIAGAGVDAGLRGETQAELGHLENALRTLEAIDLGHLSAEAETHVDGDFAVLVEA